MFIVWFWRRIDTLVDAEISNKYYVSVFRVEVAIHPKRWHLPTSPQVVKTQIIITQFITEKLKAEK